MTADMSEGRFLSTVFCDDVRQEVGNKLSFMGVYGPQLVVPAFPTTIAKLCFVITARTPVNRPFEALRFRIHKDDSILVEHDMTAGLRDVLTRMQSGPDDDVLTVIGVLQVFPLALDAPCRLKVRADTEAGELLGGLLQIAAVAAPD